MNAEINYIVTWISSFYTAILHQKINLNSKTEKPTCAPSPLVSSYMGCIFGVNLAMFGRADIQATVPLDSDLSWEKINRCVCVCVRMIKERNIHLVCLRETGKIPVYSHEVEVDQLDYVSVAVADGTTVFWTVTYHYWITLLQTRVVQRYQYFTCINSCNWVVILSTSTCTS